MTGPADCVQLNITVVARHHNEGRLAVEVDIFQYFPTVPALSNGRLSARHDKLAVVFLRPFDHRPRIPVGWPCRDAPLR
jgi:hypothetical protein